MRETVRSLRIYFIVSGLASLWYGLPRLAVDLRAPISPTTFLAAAILIVGVALALTFIYVGAVLSGLLRNSSQRIVALLYVSAGWAVLTCSGSLLGGVQPGAIAFLVISLLIVWYLLRNVRQLAAEAQRLPSIV